LDNLMRDNEIRPYPGRGFEPAPSDRGWLPMNVPTELHIETVRLVKDFAEALMAKLLKSQQKYGYTDEWLKDDWMDKCRDDLFHHTGKGDPLDVAAYCAFLWHHGESTMTPQVVETAASEMFQSLKHGDDGHQAWLKAAILAHMKGNPKPVFVEDKRKSSWLKTCWTKLAQFATKK
jgi:hypothetical protein